MHKKSKGGRNQFYPDSFALTLVEGESVPGVKLPTVAARFLNDDALYLLEGAGMIRLDTRLTASLGREELIVDVISHIDCKCPPESQEIVLNMGSHAILNFLSHVLSLRMFILIISTPRVEWRCLVDTKTERIKEHKAVSRILN